MANWTIAPSPLPGKARGGHPVVHVRLRSRLVFFPGESKLTNDGREVSGGIYVIRGGQLIKRYAARGGPTVPRMDGKHLAEPTPPGHYTLGPAHHHTTNHWYMSTIPWGAEIRRAMSGVIEYKEGGVWKPATGKRGKMTLAYVRSLEKPLSSEDIEKKEREWFDVNGKYPIGELVKVWKQNDFGVWAFNLLRGGKATVYFVHTTPTDEADWDAVPPKPISLSESHGCVHIKPADRKEMMEAGYLAAGNSFEVRGYDEVGPP